MGNVFVRWSWTFERHKDVFVDMMTIKIQLDCDKINPAQFGCFVKGGVVLDVNAQRKKPGAWLNDTAWLNAIQPSMNDPLFKELPEAILRGDKQWKEWMDKDSPEAERVPDFEERLDKLHRMLVI